MNLAFDLAEKHLDIPKMLDAEGKLTENTAHRKQHKASPVLIKNCKTLIFQKSMIASLLQNLLKWQNPMNELL